MSNLNRVLLMGRLTRDPELRYTPQGTAVCEIGLAVNREFTVNGERREDTLFIDVTFWGRQAEVVNQYMRKGRSLFIEGRLSLDRWKDRDGQNRSKHRVVAENFQFIGGGGRGADGDDAPRGEGAAGGGRLASSGTNADYGQNYRQPEPSFENDRGAEEYSPGVAEEDIPF